MSDKPTDNFVVTRSASGMMPNTGIFTELTELTELIELAELHATALDAIVNLTVALEVKDINQLPGAWEQRIDDSWYIAINGHDDDFDVRPKDSMKATIPPYHFAVWFNGWLAGLLHPFDGGVFAAGSEAYEVSFAEAVEKFIEAL